MHSLFFILVGFISLEEYIIGGLFSTGEVELVGDLKVLSVERLTLKLRLCACSV